MAVATTVRLVNVGHDAPLQKTSISRKGLPNHNELKGIVDLTNTVDRDETVKHLPAVTHEVVRPTEHHVTQEVITREIHNYDVYYRILPVIDLEILPTKHYVVDPEHPGTLREIPESEAPVKNNWSIAANPRIVPDGHRAMNDSSNDTLKHLWHCLGKSKPEPVLTDKTSYMTEQGFMRTEYFWRHPPTLDMSAYNQGLAVPLRMNCVSSGEFTEYLASQSKESKKPSETSDAAVLDVNELHRRAKESLAHNVSSRGHDSTAVKPAERLPFMPTDRATNGTVDQSHNRAHVSDASIEAAQVKTAVAEEAMVAAEAALAVAEQVVAAATNEGRASAQEGRRTSHARARTPDLGLLAVDGMPVPEVTPQTITPKAERASMPPVNSALPDTATPKATRYSWSGRNSGIDNADGVRGRLRARLQRARRSLADAGRRLNQHA